MRGGFVTIKIFARTEHTGHECGMAKGFVTIKIFARTERATFWAS